MRYVLLLTVIGLSACAADRTRFMWQDRITASHAFINDQPVWIIECESRMVGCHKKAAEICSAGYDIVNERASGFGIGIQEDVMFLELTVSCR